jgi:hypothetical protein
MCGIAGFVGRGDAGDLRRMSAGYAFYRKFFDATDFILTPLPLLSVMAFITGVLSILMGLLAELQVRTYYESQKRTPYSIKTTLNIDPGD